MNSTGVMSEKCSNYTQNHLFYILRPTKKEKIKKRTQQAFYQTNLNIK